MKYLCRKLIGKKKNTTFLVFHSFHVYELLFLYYTLLLAFSDSPFFTELIISYPYGLSAKASTAPAPNYLQTKKRRCFWNMIWKQNSSPQGKILLYLM